MNCIIQYIILYRDTKAAIYTQSLPLACVQGMGGFPQFIMMNVIMVITIYGIVNIQCDDIIIGQAIRKRLIVMRGLPGSGKSTLAR